MSSPLRALRRWLEDLPISEPLQRRHAYTLQIFALAFFFSVVALETMRLLTHGTSAATAINGVNAAIALITLAWLRRGHYRRAATLIVAGFMAVQGLAFSVGGLQFSRDGLKSIAVVMTMAALLRGRGWLWGTLAGLAGAMGIAWLRDLHHLGGAGPRLPPATAAGVFVSSLLTFLVLAVILDRFGVTVQEALTDRRRAEGLLRNSEELFRVAFQTNPGAMNITRLQDGKYVAVNEGFAQLTGWPQAEAVGRTSGEMGLWVDLQARQRALDTIVREGGIRDFEARFRRRDGTEFTGSLFAQHFDLAGQAHLLAMTRDVSAERAAEAERAQLQSQLLQSQKLESIGRVAGGVAHDLNNLLTAVLGYTDLLEGTISSPQQRSDLEQIRLGGLRASNLTRQLLSFARKQPIELRDVELGALVSGMAGLHRRLIGEEIEYVVRLGCEGVVRADPGQLEQVLLNLVVNARDAMAGPGRLTVEVRDLPAAKAAGERVRGLAPVDYVVLSVSDTGSGMTPDVLSHLFEPFFTTKQPGKGTGLGLATCYGIVQQAGGQFGVETEPGRGSTFRVYLPRATAARAEPCPPAAGKVAGGRETVLLAEDEQQLRALASRILTERGYQVLEARDGVHALEVAAAHAGHIDLLFTDVVMPRLGGRELADKLCAARPGLRVLFASGYADSPGELSAWAHALLQKPFTAPTLLSRVRQALDAKA